MKQQQLDYKHIVEIKLRGTVNERTSMPCNNGCCFFLHKSFQACHICVNKTFSCLTYLRADSEKLPFFTRYTSIQRTYMATFDIAMLF